MRAKIIWPKKEIREALPSIPPERKSPHNAVENGQGGEGGRREIKKDTKQRLRGGKVGQKTKANG
jgi:hypothetical protein